MRFSRDPSPIRQSQPGNASKARWSRMGRLWPCWWWHFRFLYSLLPVSNTKAVQKYPPYLNQKRTLIYFKLLPLLVGCSSTFIGWLFWRVQKYRWNLKVSVNFVLCGVNRWNQWRRHLSNFVPGPYGFDLYRSTSCSHVCIRLLASSVSPYLYFSLQAVTGEKTNVFPFSCISSAS